MSEGTNNVEVVVAQIVDPLLNVRKASPGSLFFQGALIFLLGLVLVGEPLVSLLVITIIAGIFMVANSILMAVRAIRDTGKRRTFGLIYSALVLILGILTLLHPLLMNVIWIVFIGAWEIIVGVEMLVNKYSANGGYMKFSGIMSILVGILFLIWPLFGLMAFIWVAGILMIALGIMMLVSAFRLSRKK